MQPLPVVSMKPEAPMEPEAPMGPSAAPRHPFCLQPCVPPTGPTGPRGAATPKPQLQMQRWTDAQRRTQTGTRHTWDPKVCQRSSHGVQDEQPQRAAGTVAVSRVGARFRTTAGST
eukprot:jgi/Ulvmu1/6594/UM003_0231.1